MHYLVLGYDHPGEEGRRRRAHARERHLAQAETMIQVKAIFGTATLDNHGDMIGSMLVMAADSREDLDAWLRVVPYVVDDVRRDVRVHPCQAGSALLPTGDQAAE
ncbi:YciI family protein [Streptomyces sp. RB6PN25]|uniref:YciI family protein n=1 Tax=Streptomyces humicola TaxID=2953240 RepID=A0ABT1Q3B9_9ACTN|nr:YciI family protein [Streptomyces humicola]MCQ4084384.1 YciI family protein [Streptomyces humicola]